MLQNIFLYQPSNLYFQLFSNIQGFLQLQNLIIIFMIQCLICKKISCCELCIIRKMFLDASAANQKYFNAFYKKFIQIQAPGSCQWLISPQDIYTDFIGPITQFLLCQKLFVALFRTIIRLCNLVHLNQIKNPQIPPKSYFFLLICQLYYFYIFYQWHLVAWSFHFHYFQTIEYYYVYQTTSRSKVLIQISILRLSLSLYAYFCFCQTNLIQISCNNFQFDNLYNNIFLWLKSVANYQIFNKFFSFKSNKEIIYYQQNIFNQSIIRFPNPNIFQMDPRLKNYSKKTKINVNGNGNPSSGTSNSHIVYTGQTNQNQNHSHILLNQSNRDDSRNYDSPNINHHVNNSVDYYYLQDQRNPNPQASRSFRSYPHQIPEGSLQAYINLLEQELQNTTYNYQSTLQAERKTASERSDFLLYLIQSLKLRHSQQLEGYRVQLANAENQREQAKALESQMKNIGVGVDEVLQQSKRLKMHNQQLQKQLHQQQLVQKEIDQQLESYQKQIEQCRNKIDEWDRAKLKINRQRKDLIELIQETERIAAQPHQQRSTQKIISQRQIYSSLTINKDTQKLANIKIQQQLQLFDSGPINVNIDVCPQTGIEEQNCDHCQQNNFEQLFTKYKAQD